MAIRSKANFSGIYLTTTGVFNDNTTGDITPADLRAGIQDFFDSQNSNWYADTSGIIGSDGSGLVGVDFNPNLSSPAWKEGRVFYDSNNKTFGVYGDMQDVTLQLGQETHVRVVNKTNAQINNGTVVAVTGAHGNRPTIEPAIADKDYAYAHAVLGIATHNIAINQEGLVTVRGTVSMNTSTYGDGSGLWLSPITSGAMQLTEPNAPDHSIKLGWSLNTTPNGKVLVDPLIGAHVSELSDVNGTAPSDYSMLTYVEDSGYWDPSSIQWDDLKVPVTQGKQGNTDLPSFDYTNIGVLFPQDDATEILYLIVQFPHAWKLGSTISPHIHYVQDTADTPTFKMDYKWYDLGSEIPASWTTITATGTLMPYTSGSIHQLLEFPEIDGSSISGVSSIMDIKLYRDDNDVTGDVLVKEFDIHYQSDSFGGSRQEYIK